MQTTSPYDSCWKPWMLTRVSFASSSSSMPVDVSGGAQRVVHTVDRQRADHNKQHRARDKATLRECKRQAEHAAADVPLDQVHKRRHLAATGEMAGKGLPRRVLLACKR